MTNLSAEERDLLSQLVACRGDELSPLLDQLDRGKVLSAYDADRLRDAIGNELMATGITRGEINGRGQQLDNLIDRVGRQSDLFDTQMPIGRGRDYSIRHNERVWKRVIVVMIALAVIGVIAAAIVVSNTTSTPGQVQLTAANVHVTKCEFDGLDGLDASADVVNPTRTEATLMFGLEFYLGKDDVGFTNMTATRVAGGKHALVSETTAPTSLVNGKLLLGHPHVTCNVVNVGSGGAAAAG